MNKERLQKFIGTEAISIVDAMAKIDANTKGVLFIVNKEGRLSGCITDGDIRRWILGAGDINASVSSAMNHSPKYLFVEEQKKAIDVLHKYSITALPLLDRTMAICDVVLLSETFEEEPSKKKDISNVPVIIMAGGKGARLYPFTKILPKPLIPIGETPIVERIINCFTGYGIQKFYMTVNYKKGMIRSYFSDLQPEYEIRYVEEPKPLGTGGSIKLIKDTFDRPLFVTNCDSLIYADYGDIYAYHLKSGNDITIISSLKNFTVPYGVLHFGDNGELLNMEEKPKLSYFINTGMYIINPETIQMIPEDTMFHMTHLVEAVMKNGGKVGIYPISEDSFLDMGEFGEMKRMEEKLNIVSE